MAGSILKKSPQPSYTFAYRKPPESGNRINGLGETSRCRPREIFHSSGRERIDWLALERFYRMTTTRAEVRTVLRILWENRRAVGPVERRRASAQSPDEAAASIKEVATCLGASVVGVATLAPELLFDGRELRHERAVSFGVPMDFDALRTAPGEEAGLAVLRGYLAVTRVAVALAEHIRALGWQAEAMAGLDTSDVLHIPLAIRAGLGELGKHGSLMTSQLGPNVRLGAVFTDLPMTPDAPCDIGAEDFCARCKRCVSACPAGALDHEKQIVRGDRKWYVDFDRCAPYFVAHHGCGLCIATCPWSLPGKAPRLSARTLSKRM